MPLTTLFFCMLFALCCIGALYAPIVGIVAYMSMYHLGLRWWLEPLFASGVRMSFMLALFTGIGCLLHFRGLNYGKRFFTSQEWLLLAMLALLVLSVPLGLPRPEFTWEDPPEIKICKVFVFLMLLTHVVTTVRRLNIVMWIFVAMAIYLGYEAFSAGPGAFTEGRVDNIGGPDFKDANFFGVHLAMTLPIIGIQFLRSGWLGRAVTLLAGVLAVNGLVLTRSRGAFLAAMVGAVLALVIAPKGHRLIIVGALVLALVGAYFLMDPGFIDRMSTIETSPESMDGSSYGRWRAWQVSVPMFLERPWGYGAGTLQKYIGGFDERLTDRAAHNTFVTCYVELGVQGFAMLLALIANGVYMLFRARQMAKGSPAEKDLRYFSYGLLLALTIFLGGGMTITHLYVEELWWFLALPVCLYRAAENLETSALLVVPQARPSGVAKAGRQPKEKRWPCSP